MTDFFQSVQNSMNQDINTHAVQKQDNQQLSKKEQEDIKNLLVSAEVLQNSVQVKVEGLSQDDISIDKHNLVGGMEKSMVLRSHIIDDIFNVKCVINKLKVIRNMIVTVLHHNLRFKNQYNLKSMKEVETYMASDRSYNTINVRIKDLENFVDRLDAFSQTVREKIGFIRDLTKLKTQECFNEK